MSNQIQPHLSLVIPAYNEINRLPAALEQISAHRTQWGFPLELIIVVEPSEDGTLAYAEKMQKSDPLIRVFTHHERQGKGFAVRSGILKARGEFIFFTDADLSTPLKDLDRNLAFFERDRTVDVIVGSRQHPDSQILQRQSWLRGSMGKTFNRLVRWLTGLNITDTQCGFKGFRRRAAMEIFSRQRLNGFSFDVEVLLLAQAMGFSVVETPVHWTNSPASHVHVMRDSLQMLQDAWSVRKLVKKTMNEFPFQKANSPLGKRFSSEPYQRSLQPPH